MLTWRQGEHLHRVRQRVVAVCHDHQLQAVLASCLGLRVEHVGVVAERDVRLALLQGDQLIPGRAVVGDADLEAGLAEEALLEGEEERRVADARRLRHPDDVVGVGKGGRGRG
jgi:ribulose-5-phosphate 4-epimerase/fuculose-1-phosphate aldolase